MRKTILVVCAVVLLLVVSLSVPGSSSAAEPAAATEGFKIAYTSAFMGNSWRTQYERCVRDRFEQYIEKGVVAEYTYVACNADVTEQLNQLNALLQEDWDVIMIDPVSVSSLTSFIEEANAKGVKLLFGENMTAYEGIPCFMIDNTLYAKAEAYYLCEKIGGSGDVVNIHGVAGSPLAETSANAAQAIYAKYGKVNVLAMGNGYWNDADAQKEMSMMLSTYGDQIDAVFCEDGMAYGIVSAFLNAGIDPAPMGGDYFKTFIDYWYANQDTIDSITTPASPYAIGRAIADCCVYIAAGYETQKLSPNPIDESISNWCEIPSPYIILEEGEMDAEWLSEFPNTKAMSIDDAYTLLEGKEATAALELYCDDDYIASMFGLEKSLWW